jgi:hypothetical protein
MPTAITIDSVKSPRIATVKPISQRKADKRWNHDFRRALEESDRQLKKELEDLELSSAQPTSTPSGRLFEGALTSPKRLFEGACAVELGSKAEAQLEGSTGEVIRLTDPRNHEQPIPSSIPTTRLGYLAFEPHPMINEPLFDKTTAQRIRERQIIDEAGNEDTGRSELGILEPDEDDNILTVDNWEDITVEVVLDSGACRHVMARENAPGYQVQDSAASRRGLGFIVGNGERIPNEGQFVLNLDADDDQGSVTRLAATFQVADLTRPLMSVSQLCEQGFRVEFKDTHALVIDSTGRTACKFQRSGQLYTSKMTLKAPEPFHRPS